MEKLFKNKYRIQSIRLQGYDYSSEGYYFVTICTRDRKCILGDVISREIKLSKIGEIVNQFWQEIPDYFNNVILDVYVIMPNHIHGIITIIDDVCRDGVTPSLQKRPTLGQIIGYFKYKTTKIANQIYETPCKPMWQSRFYEHVIRNEKELNVIRGYINNNPIKWTIDENNPGNYRL